MVSFGLISNLSRSLNKYFRVVIPLFKGDKGVELPPNFPPVLRSQGLGKALFKPPHNSLKIDLRGRWLGRTSQLIWQDQPLFPLNQYVSGIWLNY